MTACWQLDNIWLSRSSSCCVHYRVLAGHCPMQVSSGHQLHPFIAWDLRSMPYQSTYARKLSGPYQSMIYSWLQKRCKSHSSGLLFPLPSPFLLLYPMVLLFGFIFFLLWLAVQELHAVCCNILVVIYHAYCNPADNASFC